MRVTLYLRIAAMLASLASFPGAMKAQEQYIVGDTSTVTITEASFNDLNARLAALESALAEGEKKDDGWKDVSAEKWTQKITGRVHMDYVNFAGQNPASVTAWDAINGATADGDAQDYFDFRRMYLGIEGEGFGIYEYKFEVDLSTALGVRNSADNGTALTGNVQLKDVFVGIKEVPFMGTVRFGHFKAPIMLENLTSSRYISFMERSLPLQFVPERELGACAFNYSKDENFTWAYGVFVDLLDELGKQRENDNQGASFVTRGTWTPYYDEPSKGRYLIHTGAAWRYVDDQDDSVSFSPRAETGLGPNWIRTGSIPTDQFNVLGLEGAAVWGPLSVQSEFFYVPVHDNRGFHRDFYGAYAYASWFLTGENRVYKRTTGTFDRVSPYTNFWVIRGAGLGPGAVELLARWSYLDLSTADTWSGIENDFTLGVNWYWNPHVKWMLNYIHNWNGYAANPTAENDILGVSCRFDF
jgi:phosphate-selective porin OprO/OprP